MNVPAELCEKHGFKLVQSELSDIIVDWDEYLVDEEDDADAADDTGDAGNTEKSYTLLE